jgi:hypothetical protein
MKNCIMTYCFTATIIQSGDMDAAFVRVPIDIPTPSARR